MVVCDGDPLLSARGRSVTASMASLLPGSRWDHEHEEEEQEQGDEFADPLGASSLASSPSPQPPFLPFAIANATSRFAAYQHRHSSSASSGPASDALALAVASDWNSYKASVMHRFASTGTITVTTGLDILSKEPKGHKKSVTAVHLEQLEDSDKEAREEFKIISQQEYVLRLRELNDEIALAWLNNERVSALRLTIRVARLLMDTSVPHFYPTLFILVTDVMDTVGNLVWNRIKKKAEEDEYDNVVAPLPVNFTVDDVRSEAKETCNNWFYKISCIRELLPRIYLEIAILRCTIFLEKGPPVAAFQRLTMMMRGLSDPLASAYAHLYLARRGQLLLPPDAGSYILKNSSGLSSVPHLSVSTTIPESRGYLINGLHDYLILFRRVIHGEFDKNITSCGVDRRMYAMLVEPALEWIVRCLFKNANEDELALVVHTFGDAQPITSRQRGASGSQGVAEPVSVILYCMLKQLPAAYVAMEALNILRMIKSSNDISLSQHLNYKLFGMKLCDCSPPREDRITVLNDAWNVVTTYSCLTEYMEIAEVYVDYILQSCTEVELNILLKDIWKHLSKGDVLEAVLISLESIVFKLVSHYNDLTKVLNLAHVVEILDFFVGDIRLSVYKRVLTSVTRTNQKIIDPVTKHIVLEQGRVLHDSLDSLSSDDERRQITRLIVRLVQLVDYGLDLEQHLEFLVECRATFGNMDLIRETVVHISNRLAITALQFAKVSPSKQTKDFVKACLTFNGITIPSITSIIQRMHLFLETAEAALMNGLLSHTEGLVNSALMCLQDNANGDGLKVEYEDAISSFLQKLMSFLVFMPGHPELGAFYILRGILGFLNSKPGLASGRGKVRVLCGSICMLAAVGQENGLQPVIGDHVDSNDVLYYEDPLYQKELAEITTNVLDIMVISLDQASDKVQGGYQYLDACNALVTAFKVDVDLRTHCSDFLCKASAALPVTDNYLQVTLDYAQRKGNVIIS